MPRTALTLLPLIDDQKCFQTVRELRWPEGIQCPDCESRQVTKRGFDDTQQERQRYRCGGCDCPSFIKSLSARLHPNGTCEATGE